jgi:hypothetical protein
MSTEKSGIGYGNHGGDETFQDNKDQVDPTRDVPDDAGKGDYEDEDEDKPAG